MKIRILTPADVEQYREIRIAALTERPPAFGTTAESVAAKRLEALAAGLRANEDGFLLGAFEGEVLAGIARFSLYADENEKHRGFIAGVYVSPNFRRKGVGRALLVKLIERATRIPGLRRIHLTVVTTQTAAIALYESLGFQRYGTEQEAFSCDGEYWDEDLMELVVRAGKR